MSAPTPQNFDVVIAGGGLVGLSAALALAHGGFETAVVDALPAETRLADTFDGRASAVAYANFRMLDVLGCGEALKAHAQRIDDILVSDGRAPDGLRAGGPGPAFLHFDHRELGGRAEAEGEPLGYMVENRRMRAALIERARAAPRVTMIAPAKVASVTLGEARGAVALEDGRVLSAPLVVGAEGRNSIVRETAGIRTIAWRYDQAGLVATVRMAAPHHGVAHEYFLPAGPFAILPLTDNRASLVWTERAAAAKAAMALGDADFQGEIRRRFGDFLGAVTVEGPRFSYPLGLEIAERFAAPRAALVGDAARRIHPIAGQGFNLGLKDAAALAEVLSDSAGLGLDIGGLDVLDRYQAWRRPDSVTMALATDAFNRLFSTDFGPVRVLRDLGIRLVDRLPLARRAFVRAAGADLGALPKLLRGEALDAW